MDYLVESGLIENATGRPSRGLFQRAKVLQDLEVMDLETHLVLILWTGMKSYTAGLFLMDL